MTTFLAVVGSVTPPGRLNAAIATAVDMAAARPGVSASLLNLADYRVSFASRVAGADCVLLASPVYRGTFTGALKNLLDLAPIEALRAKPVGIVAMGATPHHYLGVDWQLRAVLAWFGARVVATSVYLESAHFRDGALADPPSRAALADLVNALLDMPTAGGGAFGPPPLAAGRG